METTKLEHLKYVTDYSNFMQKFKQLYWDAVLNDNENNRCLPENELDKIAIEMFHYQNPELLN